MRRGAIPPKGGLVLTVEGGMITGKIVSVMDGKVFTIIGVPVLTAAARSGISGRAVTAAKRGMSTAPRGYSSGAVAVERRLFFVPRVLAIEGRVLSVW
jgi:hypothetical protein